MSKKKSNSNEFSLENLISSSLEEMSELKKYALTGGEVSALSSCISKFDKTHLLITADVYEIEKPKKLSDEALSKLLNEKILERAQYFFRFNSEEYYYLFEAFYHNGRNDEQKEKIVEILNENYGLSKKLLLQIIFANLIRNGFVFLTKKGEEYKFFVPEDVFAATKKGEDFYPGDLQDLRDYANTLANLYGAFDIALFKQIYNRDHPDDEILSTKKLKTFLEQASSLSDKFKIKDSQIINKWIDSDQILKDLDFDRKNFKPYIPSKEELEQKLLQIDYDDDLDAFGELEDFFEENDGERDFAFDFVPYIKLRYPLKELLEILQKEYGIKFSDKQTNKFLEIFTTLNNNSHLWANWGNPPNQVLKSEQKGESAFTDEFLEEQKKARLSHHIDLPETCVVPSEEEAARKREEFDKYWGNNEFEPIWHQNGSSVLRRIAPEMKKFSSNLNKIPEKGRNQFYDQYLASIWHENHAMGGEFGSPKWRYCVFEPYEKLREDLYVCLLSDGNPVVVSSHSVGINFEQDSMSVLGVLVDMGGWFLAYGPLLGFNGLRAKDLEQFAKAVAKQAYAVKGLSGVVQFNPAPFWALYPYGPVPPISHKGKLVVECSVKTRLLNGEGPDFLSDWTHEVSKNKKYERYVLNPDEYLGGTEFYLDMKTQEVYLFSHNEENFDLWLEKFRPYFSEKYFEETRVSMVMATILKNELNKPSYLLKLEKAFE